MLLGATTDQHVSSAFYYRAPMPSHDLFPAGPQAGSPPVLDHPSTIRPLPTVGKCHKRDGEACKALKVNITNRNICP